ncbi:MAG: hypothetical protein J1E82_01265 [Muribaculaceae bacterium]|nr:hypothetical protein [Muribaculaceae bacterium]
MKNLFYSTFALISAIGITSCTTDGYQEYKRNFEASPINIITNLETGETTTSKGGTYGFELNITKFVGTITTDKLIINNNSWNFATEESSFLSVDTNDALFFNPKANVNGNSTLPIKNSIFLGTPYFYFSTNYAGDYTYRPPYGYVVAASYEIDDTYLVRTFQEDTFYLGTTITTYPSSDGGTVTAEIKADDNTNNPMVYRIHLDLEKKTAALIIYNGKFSAVPAEPTKEVIIADGLNVEFTKDGVRVYGENIVPEVGEAGATTPNPRYVFNEIDFTTTNEILTECRLTYKVAGIYTGDFTGKYVLESLPENDDKE